MKNLCFLITLSISTISLSQSNWMTLQTELTGEYDKLLNVIPISNIDNSKTALYFELANKGRVYHINAKQEILNEIQIDKLPKRTPNFVGSCTNNGAYSMFFTNQSQTRLGNIQVDFNTNSYTTQKDLLKLKDEKILANFNDKHTFYTLTYSKKNTLLKLHVFDNNGLVKIQEIDLSNEDIIDSKGIKKSLTYLFFNGISQIPTQFIDSKLPNSLETTKAKNKIYLNGSRLLITLDRFKKYTYLIDINITSGSYKFSQFEHPAYNPNRKVLGSNSFVLEDKLISILGYKNLLEVNLFSLETQALLKTLSANENNPINFSNTALQKKDYLKGKTKTLETSADFFKALKSGEIAVSGFKANGQYILTIGSCEDIYNHYAVSGAVFGGAIGGLVTAHVFMSYSSYYKSIFTEFKSTLDIESLNHVTGDITQNIFEKIVNFNSTKPNAIAPSIFKSDTNLIWGAFGKSSGFYQMFKFDN